MTGSGLGEREVKPVVLIANDQETTARAVGTILGSAGYHVVHAYTARDALAVAESSDPDVVILDHQLPDFSGVEVCRQLRGNPRFGAGLPIIITTAGPSGRAQRLVAYEAGAWEFYGQPIDADALLYKLHSYVASYRHMRDLRTRASARDTVLHGPDGLQQRATEMVARTRRNGASLCCVAWSLASVESPALLAAAVDAFRAHARVADLHGRIAPGQLVLVAAGAHLPNVPRIAERFRRVLADALPADAAQIDTATIAIDDPAQLPADGAALFAQLRFARAA